VKYALSCVRRLGLALCGASPAMPTYVEGVGRIDLCAKHSVEAMGITSPTPKARPPHAASPTAAPVLPPLARQIIAYIVAYPGTNQAHITDGLGIHRATTSAWIQKMIKAGYIRGEGRKSSPIPWRYYVIARPPGE